MQALDAEEDLGVGGGSGGEAFAAARRAQEKAEGLLAAHPLSGDPTLPHRLEALARKQAGLLLTRPMHGQTICCQCTPV